jgi:polyisoprenyl-teichoic acid--peptidoglycan teichoic acid transferase
MSNRVKKLQVPPPPGRAPQPSLPRRSRRRGGRLGTALLTVALVVSLALLFVWACVLIIGLPLILAGGEGGRVNALLLGVDRREGSNWAHRADTVMVAGVDAVSGEAVLLSIPRDLQLPIPGHGEDRINTANVYGYTEGYPGGGPALVEATIESNFGIAMDGYLMADFDAFERLVDALGGVEIEVSETLHDTQYPDPRPGDPHAYKTVHFDPGLQTMDGQRALEYARSRMSTSDFDRARRQQEVLVAIRQKALSPRSLPRLPLLGVIVLDSLETNLSPREVLALGVLAVRLDPSRLRRVVLEPPLVNGRRRADGAAIQLPNWSLINPVIEEHFP